MGKIIGFEKLYKTQYKATCKNCGAIILFDENEIKDEYQYNDYCFSSAKCPSCNSTVSFNKNENAYKEECTNQEYIDRYSQTNMDDILNDIYSSVDSIISSTTDINGWPTNITNCIRNCKECFGKCLYRKEKNPNQ